MHGRAVYCHERRNSRMNLPAGTRETVRRRKQDALLRASCPSPCQQTLPRKIGDRGSLTSTTTSPSWTSICHVHPCGRCSNTTLHRWRSTVAYCCSSCSIPGSIPCSAFRSWRLPGGRFTASLFVVYAVLAPIVLLISRPKSLWGSKNLLILGFLFRAVHTLQRSDLRHQWRRGKPDYREMQALMFLLIKIVFGPLMLYFVLHALAEIPPLLFRLNFPTTWPDELDVWFLVFFWGISVLDASVFFMGYTTEAGFMRNRLRYAETNVFRILVCIVCYEPFILATASVLGPSRHTERIVFQDDLGHPMTWILRGLAVLSLLGLISSSLFLFTRASNLTNRGIVQTGPYALVRHPGYVSKNLFWLITLIPLFFADPETPGFSWTAHAMVCGKTLLGWLAWGSIYYLRAITEEQFLSRDPEYVAYCQKVRYRFIPWVC